MAEPVMMFGIDFADDCPPEVRAEILAAFDRIKDDLARRMREELDRQLEVAIYHGTGSPQAPVGSPPVGDSLTATDLAPNGWDGMGHRRLPGLPSYFGCSCDICRQKGAALIAHGVRDRWLPPVTQY